MRYLFIVAHPDDEALGAGGTIRRLANAGHRIAVLTISSNSPTRADDLIAAQKKSHKILGAAASYNLGVEAMRFAEQDRYTMTQEIENIIRTESPDYIVTHNPTDTHNDHRITSELTREAFLLPLRRKNIDKEIKGAFFMEIPSSTDWSYAGFAPNTFAEINRGDLREKIKAIEVYDDVLRPIPHPRNAESIKALARYRGGQCGAAYAESFIKFYGKGLK